jgi:hypothetical protein
MFTRYREKKARLARIKQLQAEVDGVYEAELAGATTTEQRQEAHDIARSQVVVEENQLDYLKQADLLTALEKKGVTIPTEYYAVEEWPLTSTLTHSGEMWARRELKTLYRAEIEFWSKQILPIASLILSIIALVRSH